MFAQTKQKTQFLVGELVTQVGYFCNLVTYVHLLCFSTSRFAFRLNFFCQIQLHLEILVFCSCYEVSIMAETSNFMQPTISKFNGFYDHWVMLMEN